MATIRLHPTDGSKLIVDAKIDGRRQQLVCETIEAAMLTIKQDPSFKRLEKPVFTIDQLVARYLRRCKADKLRAFRTKATNFKMVSRKLGSCQAASLTGKQLFDWAAELSITYANSTVALAVAGLASLYREAVHAKLLWSNPARELAKVYKQRKSAQATYPTDAEESRLIANATDIHARVVLRTLLDAGLQINELVPLNNENFDGKVLKISEAVNTEHEVVPAMAHRKRSIPLSNDLITDLNAYKLVTGNAPKDPLFPTITRGRSKYSLMFVKRIAHVQAAAGLGRYTTSGQGHWKKRVPQGNYTLEQLSAKAVVKWLRSGVNILLIMRRSGYGCYERFSRRYSAVIGAMPEGTDISAVDLLIWGSDQNTETSTRDEGDESRG